MNIPPTFAKLLTDDGFSCLHARDIGLGKSSDNTIVENAKTSNEIIITHDLDYGHLLAFSGDSKPSVIIFRLGNCSIENLYYRFKISFKSFE